MAWFRDYYSELRDEPTERLREIVQNYELMYSRLNFTDRKIDWCLDNLKHLFGATSERRQYNAAKDILHRAKEKEQRVA